jgi:NMD protein affecting ribosome stability and mRNA decay
MKLCPRCGRGCQNRHERVCGECATAENLRRLGPVAFAAARERALARLPLQRSSVPSPP